MSKYFVNFKNGDSVLALGQGTWRMGKDSHKRKEEVATLRKGIELGMTVVDTAELYENEEFVGEAISEMRDKVFLVSKFLPSNANYEGVLNACERSLKKLKTDYLNLYLLHWQSSYPIEETVNALVKLQQQGKIKQWGVSNLDVPEMEEFFAVSEGNNCATNQVAYNLEHRGIEFDLVPWCSKHQIPLMAYSPLGEGSLIHNKTLLNIAERHEATISQVALAWILRNPNILVIPKAGTVEHVEDNYKSLSLDLTEKDFADLDAVFPKPTHKIPLAAW